MHIRVYTVGVWGWCVNHGLDGIDLIYAFISLDFSLHMCYTDYMMNEILRALGTGIMMGAMLYGTLIIAMAL